MCVGHKSVPAGGDCGRQVPGLPSRRVHAPSPPTGRLHTTAPPPSHPAHPIPPPSAPLQLLATRVGFAAAQATQNPICFSLIPELFPKNRTTAMAVYNTAIYAGRALSFAALILAGQLGVPQVRRRHGAGQGWAGWVGGGKRGGLLHRAAARACTPPPCAAAPDAYNSPSAFCGVASCQGVIGDIGYTLVPLDKVDLSLVSVLYTQVGVGVGGGWGGRREDRSGAKWEAGVEEACGPSARGTEQQTTGLGLVLSVDPHAQSGCRGAGMGSEDRAGVLLCAAQRAPCLRSSPSHLPDPRSCPRRPPLPPQGDYAAVSPVYTYTLDADVDGVLIESAFSAWRQLMRWLGPPGLVMAALALLTVEEPRQRGRSGRFMPLMTLSRDSMDEGDLATPIGELGQPAGSSGSNGSSSGSIRGGGDAAAAAASLAGGVATAAILAPLPPGTLVSAPEQEAPASIGESLSRLRGLAGEPAFLSLTLAAALNDVGSWSLVSWQATFYQRVYELPPSTYAPLLAVVIPVGGIIGGVGAGGPGGWVALPALPQGGVGRSG